MSVKKNAQKNPHLNFFFTENAHLDFFLTDKKCTFGFYLKLKIHIWISV